MRTRLLQLQHVILDARPAGVALAGVIVAAAVGWCWPWSGDSRVSVSGMLLQLLGISTVALGLSRARRQFGRPSLKQELLAWLKQAAAVFAPSKSVTGVLTSPLGGVTMMGTATVRGTLAPGATLEARLEAVETALRSLQSQVDKSVDDLHCRVGQLKGELEREANERRQRDAEGVRMIEEFAVGGLRIEGIGLFWLSLGVLATSIPTRIAGWLGWLA